jgi:monoamine oxidase
MTRPHEDQVDVVVIGAGMAGAAAAGEVRRSGRSALLLEARPRIGGRVDTRLVAGHVAELGAQVLHGSATHVLDIVEVTDRLVGVERGDIETSITDAAGMARSFADLGPDFVSPVALAARLKAVSRALGELAATRTSLEVALSGLRVSRASATALRAWYEQVTGSEARDVPLFEVTSARVYQYHGEREYRAPEGLAALVAEVSDGVLVRLGWVVERVSPDGAGVLVSGRHEGRPMHVRAGRCVVTVPPTLLASGRLVVDGMPGEQLDSAARVRLAEAVTAAVPLREPAPHTGFHFDVGGPLGFTSWEAHAGHVTVVAKGAAAGRLRELARTRGAVRDAVARAVPALQPAGPDDAPALVADWGADEWAGGAFTLPGPRAAEAARSWPRPVADRVFFAGESTAAGTGSPFLDRAYRTGRAAARAAVAGFVMRRPA